MKFEMAEIQVEKFALVDVIAASLVLCDNETPPIVGEED